MPYIAPIRPDLDSLRHCAAPFSFLFERMNQNSAVQADPMKIYRARAKGWSAWKDIKSSIWRSAEGANPCFARVLWNCLGSKVDSPIPRADRSPVAILAPCLVKAPGCCPFHFSLTTIELLQIVQGVKQGESRKWPYSTRHASRHQ